MNSETIETAKSPATNPYQVGNVLQFALQKDMLSSKEEAKMSKKSATVSVRIDPEVKAKAEAILSELGLPVSVAIDTLYRQIIITGGLPYSINVFKRRSEEEMSEEEISAMLQESEAQCERGETRDAKEFLAELKKDFE